MFSTKTLGKKANLIKIVVIAAIFVIAAYQRLQYFDQVGKDIYAYERAITDFFSGINPYKWTVESFSNPDDPGNHGFSYFPSLLYVNGFLYLLALLAKVPFQFVWKVPVLLADLGIGFLVVKHFGLKKFFPLVLALLFWFVNPYFFLKSNYVYFDPIAIFFMLLGLHYLKKDDVLAGSFLALAVSFKTFPMILIPLFLLKAKSMPRMLVAMVIIGLYLSAPFMTSVENFTTYLKGTLFVHQERFVQGRPFLFYISYFYKIEFFQIVPLKLYSFLAIVSGWVVTTVLLLYRGSFNKYILASLAFALFYLFTPVLNRTYLIWGMPVFAIGAFELAKNYKQFLYYLLIFGYWGFYYWYLFQWKDGFHIWRPL